jgi:DNA replication initiation complex subunit (GINS family)
MKMKTETSGQKVSQYFEQKKYDELFEMYENGSLTTEEKIRYQMVVNNCTEEKAELIVNKKYLDTGI